jgi:hypothetical protein
MMKINKEEAKELLKIRDALLREDIDEAYHILCSLADPLFGAGTTWNEWERIRDE